MRFRKAAGLGAILALALPLCAPAGAQVNLGADPTECEIQAALLGKAGPGCPPPRPPVPPPVIAAPVRPPPVTPQPEPTPAPVIAAPAAPVVPERRASFLITFARGSTRITPASTAVLDRVAAVMTEPAAASLRFRVIGHTDAVGNDAANLALSKRRAKAVVDYLVAKRGVAASRLDSDGMGESDLADPAHPNAEANRRVEIVAIGG